MLNTKELGNLGEKLACEYLVKKGYKILGKNYSITSGKNKVFGEIDIITKKRWSPLRLFRNDKTIHFIEVKTIMEGKSNFYPEEKVNYKKKNKLRKLCLIWLQKNKFPQNCPYQIDVIGILINLMVHKPKISHFKNVVEDK